jgi:hypothetical protein
LQIIFKNSIAKVAIVAIVEQKKVLSKTVTAVRRCCAIKILKKSLKRAKNIADALLVDCIHLVKDFKLGA